MNVGARNPIKLFMYGVTVGQMSLNKKISQWSMVHGMKVFGRQNYLFNQYCFTFNDFIKQFL